MLFHTKLLYILTFARLSTCITIRHRAPLHTHTHADLCAMLKIIIDVNAFARISHTNKWLSYTRWKCSTFLFQSECSSFFSPSAPSRHCWQCASVPAREIEPRDRAIRTHTQTHSIDLKFNDFISLSIHTYGNWVATHSKFIFTIAIQIGPNDYGSSHFVIWRPLRSFICFYFDYMTTVTVWLGNCRNSHWTEALRSYNVSASNVYFVCTLISRDKFELISNE